MEHETNPQVPWDLFERKEPITDPGEQTYEHETPYPQDAGGNIYHVYMVKEPNAQPAGVAYPLPMEEDEQEQQRPRLHRVFLPLALASLLVVGLIAGVAVAYVAQVPTASVTIIPREQSITIQASVEVDTATGSSNVAPQSVPGRALPTMTLSQATTAPTSGTGHQDAQAARGLLTFYNGLPQGQVVSAGTLLTSSTGVQIVTEEDAMIPAASLPTSGQVTVSAHTLTFGPAGNIVASSVSMPCCRENVYVQNTSAFSGGQLARSFPAVARQDLAAAMATLGSSVQQSVQAAMQPQIRVDETLITPLPCTAKVSSNHAVGEEAAQVMVSLDETCHAVVYRTSVMQHLVTRLVEQEAMHRLGTGYRVSGEVQSRVIQVQQDQQQRRRVISVQVQAIGACIYQFGREQLAHLKGLIAGKSKQEATRLLLEQTGVSTISLEIKGRETETLPVEVGSIQVLVITPAA